MFSAVGLSRLRFLPSRRGQHHDLVKLDFSRRPASSSTSFSVCFRSASLAVVVGARQPAGRTSCPSRSAPAWRPAAERWPGREYRRDEEAGKHARGEHQPAPLQGRDATDAHDESVPIMVNEGAGDFFRKIRPPLFSCPGAWLDSDGCRSCGQCSRESGKWRWLTPQTSLRPFQAARYPACVPAAAAGGAIRRPLPSLEGGCHDD